jgi:hypothetical protein
LVTVCAHCRQPLGEAANHRPCKDCIEPTCVLCAACEMTPRKQRP